MTHVHKTLLSEMQWAMIADCRSCKEGKYDLIKQLLHHAKEIIEELSSRDLTKTKILTKARS
jgi:hypothetical protein